MSSACSKLPPANAYTLKLAHKQNNLMPPLLPNTLTLSGSANPRFNCLLAKFHHDFSPTNPTEHEFD